MPSVHLFAWRKNNKRLHPQPWVSSTPCLCIAVSRSLQVWLPSGIHIPIPSLHFTCRLEDAGCPVSRELSWAGKCAWRQWNAPIFWRPNYLFIWKAGSSTEQAVVDYALTHTSTNTLPPHFHLPVCPWPAGISLMRYVSHNSIHLWRLWQGSRQEGQFWCCFLSWHLGKWVEKNLCLISYLSPVSCHSPLTCLYWSIT